MAGSPTAIQKELGYVSLGIGICGFLVVKFRGAFWAPIIIIATVFFVGAALIHLQELLALGNFNPGNTLIIIPDLFGPVTLVILGLLTLPAKRR